MFKKIAIAATLAMLASSSFAAGPVYGGADFGSTKIDGLSDRQTSYGAFIGYNFHENFGLEAGYRRLGDFDGVEVDQAALSVVGTLPLSNGFNVYGRLGYNHLESKASAGNFSYSATTSGAMYGVGAGYAFSPTVSGRIEVQKPSSDSTSINAGVSSASTPLIHEARFGGFFVQYRPLLSASSNCGQNRA
jgi:OOP family OmpA-OmpF porin